MKYPKINRQPRREVTIPQLSGGLNLRDSLTGIKDNQMTDCVNMWYKDGALRTRPSFVTNENMCITSTRAYDDCYIADIKSHPEVKNGDAVLVSCIDCDGTFKDGAWITILTFFWQYPDKTVLAGSVDCDLLRDEECKTDEEIEMQLSRSSRLVFEKDGYIYLFLNEKGSFFDVYKAKLADGLKWEFINADEYYIPTVYAHCLPTNNGWRFTATQFESYNSLYGGYKMVYSLYNPVCEKHPMIYQLADIDESKNYTIEATIIGPGGEEEKYIVEKNSGALSADSEKVNDRIMSVVFDNGRQFIVFTPDGDYQNKAINLTENDNYAEDNLVITVMPKLYYENKNKAKVFSMTQSVWFGGAADGINGGSRLFICGNNDENNKSLIMWSALNNPLYFPENNYAYVGDKSQGVTAFGKQGENLVIFKEKSIYYTHYVAESVTADDLINQTVIDYEAESVCFPMIQLNASIGCDCPNTVELCRNRLVWANSDGSVYTLFSNNQYSERTIYKVSEMISAALGTEKGLKNAVSCDFEGHYLLGVGNKIYVMDYNSYGYQYASSFSKNEDSNLQIPWYVWEVGNYGYSGKIFEIDNKLMLINSFQKSDGLTLTFSILSADEYASNDKILICDWNDELIIREKKINSKLQTKLFDFSAAGYLKNVDRVSVGFGNNGCEPINVGFVTDKGSDSETVLLVGGLTDERDAAFVTVKNFYPSLRAVRTFGVKIECDGTLYISGLSMQYRLLGGVK